MIRKFFRIFCIPLATIIAVILGMLVLLWYRDFSTVKITFFDVGQGDATLISQGNTQILIDGGRSGTVLLERLGRAVPFWDRYIEAVVATHPDEDHIGGLPEMLDAYRAGVIIRTGVISETAAFRALKEREEKQSLRIIDALSGVTLRFSGGTLETIHPLAPLEATRVTDTNATSIVMKLTLDSGKTFLFTGDLPSTQEALLSVEHIDVLKVGHHGSKNSSSNAFLDTLQPKDAILSVGANNRYGHPAPETLDRLKSHHASILRTDTQGNIEYRCSPKKESDCVVSTGKR